MLKITTLEYKSLSAQKYTKNVPPMCKADTKEGVSTSPLPMCFLEIQKPSFVLHPGGKAH